MFSVHTLEYRSATNQQQADIEAEGAAYLNFCMDSVIEEWEALDFVPRLTPGLILYLHKAATENWVLTAGTFRDGQVEITGSKHTPPDAFRCPDLIQEMCDDLNENLESWTPERQAAYALWRMCWIHPFDDGNGRTARAVAYAVLCRGHKRTIPGSKMFPELMVSRKLDGSYYQALEASDTGDHTPMQELILDCLAEQLESNPDLLPENPNPV